MDAMLTKKVDEVVDPGDSERPRLIRSQRATGHTGQIDADVRLERLLGGDEPRWLIFHQDAVDQVREIELAGGQFRSCDPLERLAFATERVLDRLQLRLRLGQHDADGLRLGVGQVREVAGQLEELVAGGGVV